MQKHLQAVVVGYRPNWCKWPDTIDKDFSNVLSHRFQHTYTTDNNTYTVTFRWYPVYRAYTVANDLNIPTKHPFIDNTNPPSQTVIGQMIRDLSDIANDGCELCLWENMYQCFPQVAEKLRGTFKHSIMIHANDCLIATSKNTEPVAAFFDSVIHGNIIWKSDGALTKDLYKSLGVEDTHYMVLGTTGGFIDGLLRCYGKQAIGDTGSGISPVRLCTEQTQSTIDISARIESLAKHAYHNDLVFVGGGMGEHRAALNAAAKVFDASGLNVKLYGIGMRDGPLLPRDPATLGSSIPSLYLDSFAVLNRQFIGLMGTRPFDAWATGNVLVQCDPVGELDQIGVLAGTHYASYDGTINGLIDVVRYYKKHSDEAIEIAKAGNMIGVHLIKTYSINNAIETILSKNLHKFG